MPDVTTISFRRRHLPHWMVAERPYFVTFRLHGTLPPAMVRGLRKEREALLQAGAPEADYTACVRRQFVKIEAVLDAAEAGMYYLEKPEIASLVLSSFDWLESERGWRVHAVTVMPSHVHALLRNSEGRNHELSRHLGELKSYTARRGNKLLGRHGSFWQKENFDHWCRDAEKFDAAKAYIVNNPVKAGLVRRPEDWPWTRVKS